MNNRNRLGVERTGTLLRQFALPSIVAMLVGSLYNIVDQFFIGRSVGELGNAATNIAFPLTTSCLAIALMFGIGGASAFNLHMGRGEKEKAAFYFGNAATLLFACGLLLCIVTEVLLDPMLRFFGSPLNVLDYAKEYTRITAIGFPFVILSTGGGHLLRADGRPKLTMICNMTGAVINTILDYIFVFVCGFGMKGAALATIIGQLVAVSLVIRFLSRCQSLKMERKILIPRWEYAKLILSLGAAPCFNQLAMMVVQIVLNKSLKYYGSLSVYGESIPIACVGIISKVSMVFYSIIIGIAQGIQPIAGFNYGARAYDRVRRVYIQSMTVGLIISTIAFLLFQIFPREIISIFGGGSEEYYKFAVNYLRIFLFFTFANCFQPITSNFFTAIGKPKFGIFLSLTRQIIFLLPLIVILPLITGIDGIMFAGPVADLLAAIIAVVFVLREFRRDEYRIKA